MKRRLPLALVSIACLAALVVGVQGGSAKPPARASKGFFGISPQSPLTNEDARYMKAGGIEAVRWPLVWSATQAGPNTGYDWSGFDRIVTVAARHGLRILPFVLDTPDWVAGKPTTLPIDGGRARAAWSAFLSAAVERYGPGGEFWAERAPGAVQSPAPYAPEVPVIPRPVPIREWQVWNEANFFYFALPASPSRYAKLLRISSLAIKGVDPSAKVVLTGLFGKPTARGSRGMPADEFLDRLYRVRGIKNHFDGIALHPYAVDAETLEELVEGVHEVTRENRDRVPLYITEMGWGSEDNFQQVAFEQGIRGQVRQLKAAYAYLLEDRQRLNLKQVYWYSWKDITSSTCNFCDSVGFFHNEPGLRPKPSWRAFVSITRGRARP